MDLKDMKNSYPVQMAEYTVQRCIADDPAFTWCILHVLAKCNCIIRKLKSNYWFITRRFGANIPKSVQEANSFEK